jgi:subtilase family protein
MGILAGRTGPIRRRSKWAADARCLPPVLFVALLLVALATPAPASPAVKTTRVTTSAVELVQYRRRPLKAKKLPRRLKPGRISADDHTPPNKIPHRRPGGAPDSAPDRPRDTPHDRPRDRPHDRPTHDDPRQPKQTRDPRYPRFPPVVILPDVPAEQAAVLQSLPRRMDERAKDRPVLERVAREILVLVDQTRPQSLGSDLARAYGLDLVSSRPIALIGARAELLRVPAGRSEAVALAALQRDPRVRAAQFNWLYFHSGDDRREPAAIPQYGPRKVHLPEAHQMALGRNVTVAVIDSAIDTAHPDLKGVNVRSFDAVGGPDPAPDFHGTAVAGIIASRGVVEGVAPQAEILAVRAFRTKPGSPPDTTTEILLGAIDWAASNGAKVLNLSFVGPRSGHLQELLDAVRRKGVVVVAAAGNAGPRAPPAFPAAFPGVIAVTAVDAADRRYPQANRGRYIAISAPGVDVLAPVEGGKHELLSGTSFATAYVSGIAALLLERDPSLDATAIAQLMAAAADDLGPAGRDEDFGAGRVNALATLKSVREIAAR